MDLVHRLTNSSWVLSTNITDASFLIFPWRRVEWIRRDRSRERGRHQVSKQRRARNCVFKPLHCVQPFRQTDSATREATDIFDLLF